MLIRMALQKAEVCAKKKHIFSNTTQIHRTSVSFFVLGRHLRASHPSFLAPADQQTLRPESTWRDFRCELHGIGTLNLSTLNTCSHQFNTLDAYSKFKSALEQWQVGTPFWTFSTDLHQIVAYACPSGAAAAFRVWHMFRSLKWRLPDSPLVSGDFGISWYELALYCAIHTGSFLPIWIYSKDKKLPTPYSFDSEEAKIQPADKKSLWQQAGVLRSTVRYLENTLQCKLYPRYLKIQCLFSRSTWLS